MSVSNNTEIKSENSFKAIDFQWDQKASEKDLYVASKCPKTATHLFQLHRKLEESYRNLPWPKEVKHITLFTEVKGGRGDISAAAKVITVMQNLCPDLLFEWIVMSGAHQPESFLTCKDPSKVKIHIFAPKEKTQTDFLILGPVRCSWNNSYLTNKFKIQLQGPRFDFLENAEYNSHSDRALFVARLKVKEDTSEDHQRQYHRIHRVIFPSQSTTDGGLAMGLQEGTGIFLDERRIEASLSRKDCCPKYLYELEDLVLKEDLFCFLGVKNEISFPNYDNYSLNSGYAHRANSWARFIDFVAMDEKKKNVIVVLNQKGEFEHLQNAKEFANSIFTLDRVHFLVKLGYSKITIKGEEDNPAIVLNESKVEGRELSIIIRNRFLPSDMRCLQLASERLLATGDNTAAESFAARCKLYVYEDVANGGCKAEFLKQQIVVAEDVYPPLAELLKLFDMNPMQLAKEMHRVEEILKDSSLPKKTLEFCEHVIRNYSFKNVLEGALKRAAWHHILPELMDEEAEALDEEYKSVFVKFLKNSDENSQKVSVKNLPLLASRIEERVQKHLKKN